MLFLDFAKSRGWRQCRVSLGGIIWLHCYGFVVSAFSGYIWLLRAIDKCWKLFIIHGVGVLRTV